MSNKDHNNHVGQIQSTVAQMTGSYSPDAVFQGAVRGGSLALIASGINPIEVAKQLVAIASQLAAIESLQTDGK